MLLLIEQHRREIESLCARHGVRRLELFGSAARGQFDPAKSDVDFLVGERINGTALALSRPSIGSARVR
jgi:predicted nucleotidyltransferase